MPYSCSFLNAVANVLVNLACKSSLPWAGDRIRMQRGGCCSRKTTESCRMCDVCVSVFFGDYFSVLGYDVIVT
jgi:hypothetical protein